MQHPAFAVVLEVQILPGPRVFGPGVYYLFSKILSTIGPSREVRFACLPEPRHALTCARFACSCRCLQPAAARRLCERRPRRDADASAAVAAAASSPPPPLLVA